MREIKCRGKSIETGEWVFGEVTTKLHPGKTQMIVSCGEFSSKPYDIIEVDPETVGQFTGEVDKVNNEIYDHDILSMDNWSPKEVQIKFIEGAFCLAFLGGEYDGQFCGDIHYIHHADRPQATVVSNMHKKS